LGKYLSESPTFSGEDFVSLEKYPPFPLLDAYYVNIFRIWVRPPFSSFWQKKEGSPLISPKPYVIVPGFREFLSLGAFKKAPSFNKEEGPPLEDPPFWRKRGFPQYKSLASLHLLRKKGILAFGGPPPF